MTRVLTGLAAWLGGTALAVCLAWFGANMVVRDAGVSSGVQVINADPAAPATAPATPPAPPTPPASATPTASDPRHSSAASSPPPSRSPSATPSAKPPATPSATAAAGTVRSYTLDGGRVALLVSGDSATLVTAVPDSGFSVETWSGTDWLRVDFSSGAQISSLIASWYEHQPSVTVTN
jgi:hypothetical protein